MPVSPITGKTDLVTYKLFAGGVELGGEYQVLDIEIEKAVNKIGTARIVLTLEYDSGEDKTFEFSEESRLAPGEEIEVQLGYHSDDTSIFKGIIVNIGIRAYASMNQLILDCSDKAIKLTLDKKNKYFKDKKDSEIMSGIIADAGCEASVDETTYTFKQLIQYYATDWDFLRLRAEANGLLVYTDDGKVFVKKPGVSETPDLEVNYGKDVISINGKVDSRFQIPSIKTHGWSMSDQKLTEGVSTEPSVNAHGNLTGKKLTEAIGYKEYELHSTGPLEQADLKEWANGHLLKSRLSRIYGDIEIVGSPLAKLNTTIEIKGFGARMNGKALITKVNHKVQEGVWVTIVGFGLSPEFYADRPEVHGPPASGLLPAIYGLQNGKVKKIDSDPDGQTRVLVDIPVIAESGDGVWARLAKFYATNGKGAFFMPEIDDEVVIGFLNNDPRFPIILGSLYSSKITSPYQPDEENSIKAIVTKNDLKLEFDDKEKIITIETPAGNKAIFSDKDKSILITDQTGNKMEMNTSGITIDSPKEINISAASNINIKSKANIEMSTAAGNVVVKGNDVSVTANMNLTAKGNMNSTFEAGLNATVKSGLNMTIQGLMVMIN
jgi:Rhs element Vgr protein